MQRGSRRGEAQDGGKRSRSRRRRRRSPSGAAAGAGRPEDLFRLEVLTGRHEDALPMFDILIDEEGRERVVPHVCANGGAGYAIRVTNLSRRHVACAVSVDGENALLRDGSLIVAPDDSRELPGFLVSKNFVGKEYVKEFRDFRFGKPKVIEGGPAPDAAAGDDAQQQLYKSYGRVECEVYEAVLDEEVDSDQELRGQTTFYRGTGLNGSFEERQVPEGKKKHFLYSSVTVQGPRSAIANSTRGRWWVRGARKLTTLEVRYREAHSLMLLGVDSKALGLARIKDEDQKEGKAEKGRAKKEEEDKDKEKLGPDDGMIHVCDLTEDNLEDPVWTVAEGAPSAQPVDIDEGAAPPLPDVVS